MKIYQHLDYALENRVVYLTLNRPELHNALNDVLMIELKDAIMVAEQDTDAKVIVIRANGSEFCTGFDPEYLNRLKSYNMEQNLADSSTLAQLYLSIYRSTKIVIAQVQGSAEASGCGILTVCDFVFVVPETQFGFTEVHYGFVPAVVMPFLLRKIGETRAKELMLSGKVIDAHTAVNYNLVNQIVPKDEISSFVKNFGEEICNRNSAASLQLTKKMIADIQDFPLENAIKFGAKMSAYARITDDSKKGIMARLEQEEISW